MSDGDANDTPADLTVSPVPPVPPVPPAAPVPPAPQWSPSTKQAVAVGLAVFAVIVMYLAREAITLVALSAVLAFLVAPVVRLLNNRLRVPRGLALAFGYLLVLIMVLLISVVVATGVFNSVREVDPPETIETLRKNAVSFLGNVEEVNVFGYDVDLSEVVGPLKESLNTSDSDEPGTSGTSGGSTPAAEPSQSQGTAPPKPAAAGDAGTDTQTPGSSTIILGRDQFNLLAGSAVDSLRTVGGIVVALLVSALVTLMVAIYLSADSHKFREGAKRYIPRGYENDVWLLSNRVNRIWKGYLYGQLINSLATGFLVWLVLWAIGLPGAFVLGVIMALLNMIPTFGPVLAAVPGVLSAIALGSTRFEMSNIAFAILVVVVYLVVVQLQANVMAPFITGKAVSMSPATIIIGLVVGVQVAGLIGALLVVPVIATAKELVKYLASKLVDRDPFAPLDDPTPLADPTPTPDTAPDGIT